MHPSTPILLQTIELIDLVRVKLNLPSWPSLLILLLSYSPIFVMWLVGSKEAALRHRLSAGHLNYLIDTEAELLVASLLNHNWE
jgi:hypothetical protein